MTTGQTLQALRKKKGDSLNRVAGRADLSTSVLFNAERDRKRITLDTLTKIVELGLGISMVEFFVAMERGRGARLERKARKAAA